MMRKIATVGIASLTGLGLMGGPLFAATYEIDLSYGDPALSSQGVAFWDFYYSENTCDASDGYTPLYDGAFVGTGDGFDGGFLVTVGSTDFQDPDGFATRDGNVVKSGAPAAVEGLNVSSTARAIQTSPTLQYLVKLRNPGETAVNTSVIVSTDLGSDGGTTILGDSSGDGTHANNDRWLVSADAATAPFGDPVVTQVLKGKKARAATSVATALTSGNECLGLEYTVKVPADSTRYLLLFAELHDNNGAGKKAAIKHASVYDSQKTMGKVLKGIAPKIYSKIVNWNLKK